MGNSILYERIRKAAKAQNLTLIAVAKKFDSTYNTNDIHNSLKGWGSKSDPSATNLYRLSTVLDCDMDYLMGKQEAMKKDVDLIAQKTGLTYEAMENILLITKYFPDCAQIINDLFCEERENDETGEQYTYPSSLLINLLNLCNVDYGPSSLGGHMEIKDVYGKNYSQYVGTDEYFQFSRYTLFAHLCEFIEQKRAKNNLPIYKEINDAIPNVKQ